ncbi:MAG: LytTR family DNA-binding domain-containing protein [Firmicutes bacterium]|nr:LytTR family DNA-binding domain-containing protein [Bacillota bacterium]
MCNIVYRIAICDDDESFVRRLTDQVSELLSVRGVEFDIAAFPSGEALLNHVNEKSAAFDLFLLDIYIKEINGVDTAKAIRLVNDSAAIIFTTSSEQHVFSGYEVQALQYLLKPVSRQALSAALTVDLKRRYENRYFVFKAGGGTQKVPYDEIEYLESTMKSVKLVTKQGVYEIYERISNLENILPKLSFCRCHRGFIVNFRQTAKISAQSVTTVQGTLIPIGKTYAGSTSRAFLNYIGGNEEA